MGYVRKSVPASAIILVAILLTVTASSAPPRDYHLNWTSFRGNSMNQASSNMDPGMLERSWEFKADGAITTSVVVFDDIGIFATSEGTVYCLNVQNGSKLWNASVGSPVYSTPGIDQDNEAVYVCDSSGKVTSMDIHTGETKWLWDTGSGREIRSSPLIADKIYFGSYDSYLYALNKNGTLAWRFEGCLGWIHTSPSFYDDKVYFGSCDGTMRALEAGTGEEIWNFSAAYIPSSPAVFDGKVFFGAYDSNFYCLDALSGELVWNTTMGDNVYSSPAVNGELVTVGSNDGKLYGLDIKDGTILWTLDLGPGPLESSPLIAGTKTAVNYDQGLVVVHLSNGAVSQRFLWGDAADTSPSIYDDQLFFGDAQGYVYCLKGNGKLVDDDGSLDLNQEVDPGRDTIFFIIAVIMVLSTVVFIFLRKYRRIRKQE